MPAEEWFLRILKFLGLVQNNYIFFSQSQGISDLSTAYLKENIWSVIMNLKTYLGELECLSIERFLTLIPTEHTYLKYKKDVSHKIWLFPNIFEALILSFASMYFIKTNCRYTVAWMLKVVWS